MTLIFSQTTNTRVVLRRSRDERCLLAMLVSWLYWRQLRSVSRWITHYGSTEIPRHLMDGLLLHVYRHSRSQEDESYLDFSPSSQDEVGMCEWRVLTKSLSCLLKCFTWPLSTFIRQRQIEARELWIQAKSGVRWRCFSSRWFTLADEWWYCTVKFISQFCTTRFMFSANI